MRCDAGKTLQKLSQRAPAWMVDEQQDLTIVNILRVGLLRNSAGLSLTYKTGIKAASQNSASSHTSVIELWLSLKSVSV